MKNGGWLDNFGKADNANDSNVSLSEDFVGLGYDTKGRNYSPAWGGQFQQGGTLPGSPGFMYARTIDPAPSNGKYAKKTKASAQKGKNIEKDATNVAVSDKIAQLQLLQSPEYQYRKYLESLPQLRQGLSREEEFKRDAMRYADVTTDVMQLGNFVPHPAAQFVGKVGNVAGGMIDSWQAVQEFNKGNYTSAGINAASAFVPNYLGSKGKGYLRSIDNVKPNSLADKISDLTEQGQFYRPLNYAKPSHKNLPVITSGLNFNRSLLGTNLIETVNDAIPEFQNGGEMKFYQEGLDWKPRSMQDGGDEIYQGLELPEFVVEGKDERMKEAMSQGIRKFYAYVGELMGAPQKEMMQLITGKEQTPSEAFGFQNTGRWLDNYSSFGKNLSNFAMDAVLDPINLLGVGIADDIARTTLKGASKKLASSADDVSKSFKSEIDWAKWNSEIPTNQALTNEYNTIEQTSKANGTWMKNPDGSVFKGTPEQFVQQNSENFKKAFGNSKLVNPDGSPTIQYHGSAKKFDTFDESKFQLGDAGYSGKGIYTTPSKVTANSYALSSAKFHKGDIEPTVYELYGKANNPISSSELIKNKKDYDLFNFYRDKDWKGQVPIENQMRNYDAAIADQLPNVERIRPWNDAREIVFPTNKQLKSAIGNNGMFDMTNPNIYKGLIPAGIATALTFDQQKNGGITKDNQGYWNPDNWGKPVEIDQSSPDSFIDMTDVYEPLLAVSNKGEERMMYPGEKHKFKGSKVTEIPVAKLGINQLDAQPKKKLNQLLNFTNNPDKTNWLDNLS